MDITEINLNSKVEILESLSKKFFQSFALEPLLIQAKHNFLYSVC